ncbi:LysR substrate-binding domain-containing protein [Streptomyces sp. NPDC045251]|uniref:LysR substrate-binding domain-containing protein n=1 Tax=unclassified Streptomyces TaxID=2593676 RepID=UPI00340074D2
MPRRVRAAAPPVPARSATGRARRTAAQGPRPGAQAPHACDLHPPTRGVLRLRPGVAAGIAPSLDDPRFEQYVLMDDLMDLAVPADHRLAARSTVDLADASTEDWIAPHHDHTRLIESLCSAVGFAPRFVHRADAWHAVLSLVSHGFGVCLVPRLAPSPSPDVARVRLRGEPPPFRRILACVRSGTGQDPTVSDGLDALRQQAHRHASGGAHAHRGLD